MPVKGFAFEIKQTTETGSFRGLASTYLNTDQGGDMVMPGAFTRTLQDGKKRPLLMAHDQPIGMCSLIDSPDGLVCDGQLLMTLQAGKDAYELCKAGIVTGLSIGFQTVKEAFVGEVRQLQELRLFEVSLTPFPMNEQAQISAVKSAKQQQQERIRIVLKSFRADVLAALK